MGEVESEYRKLKGLVDRLSKLVEMMQEAGKQELFHDAEMAVAGTTGNPQATDILERNLRNVRLSILSELAGISKHYG